MDLRVKLMTRAEATSALVHVEQQVHPQQELPPSHCPQTSHSLHPNAWHCTPLHYPPVVHKADMEGLQAWLD